LKLFNKVGIFLIGSNQIGLSFLIELSEEAEEAEEAYNFITGLFI
jgi:hypothetical protein